MFIKTTSARDTTAANLRSYRGNDYRYVKVGRQTRDAGMITVSGANMSPWLYGGSPGRYRRIFGTPEGKTFVRELEDRVKANAAEGKTTRLLDIGPGMGRHWLPVINRLRKHGRVELEALNPTPMGRGRSPVGNWRVGAVETKDLRRRYDGILCTYAGFDKSEYPVEVLGKMAKLNKRGGIQYLIFGRDELGSGIPAKRPILEEALRGADPAIRITLWREPRRPGFKSGSVKSYRRDLMFVRGG